MTMYVCQALRLLLLCHKHMALQAAAVYKLLAPCQCYQQHVMETCPCSKRHCLALWCNASSIVMPLWLRLPSVYSIVTVIDIAQNSVLTLCGCSLWSLQQAWMWALGGSSSQQGRVQVGSFLGPLDPNPLQPYHKLSLA